MKSQLRTVKKIAERFVLPMFIFLGFFFSPAWAAPVRDGNVEAELVADVSSIQPGTPFWVAVRLGMDEGWHTYWKNPGDSGLATNVEWILPLGFEAGPLEWPYPQRISTPPFFTFGYEGEVFLFAKIIPYEAVKPGTDEIIQAKITWLSCQEICVPGSADLELILPVSGDFPEPDEEWKEKLVSARRALPQESKGWQMRTEKKGSKILLRLKLLPGVLVRPETLDFFPFERGALGSEKPLFRQVGDELFAELPLQKQGGRPVEKIQGVLVSKDGWGGHSPGPALLIDVVLEKKFGWLDWPR